MKKPTESFNNRHYIVGLIILFVYFISISFQGFDLCDEGAIMGSGKLVFDSPQSVEYYFFYYLGILFSGIWNILFGWGGYFSFRLFSVMVILLTYSIVYKTLKDISASKHLILLGYAMVLLTNGFILAFHHNYLSSLFAASIVYLLNVALKIDKTTATKVLRSRYLFVASMLTGINVFTRLTNIALISVLAISVIIMFIYNRNTKALFSNIGIACLGFLTGISVVILLLIGLNHWNVFVSSIKYNLMSAATSSSSSHSIVHLIHVYISNYILVAKFAVLLFVPYLVGRFFSTKFRKSTILFNLIYALCLLLILYKYQNFSIFILYAVAIVLSVYTVYKKRNDIKTVHLLGISLSIAIFLPFGSDFGIGNMGSSSLIILLPLCWMLLYKDINETKSDESITRFTKLSLTSFFILYILLSIYRAFNGCYFDDGSRLERHYLIKESSLANTFTTKEKAEEIDNLLKNLKPYIKEGDTTLFFQSFPTLHYLTNTKPYLHNPWPWCYDSDNMERQFARAEAETTQLPVVVREKGKLPGGDWLSESELWDSTDGEDSYVYKAKKIALIREFLSKHNYKLVWEDNCFQILIP